MIEEKEYAKRRKRVINSLENNSLSILLSAVPKSRSNDTEYPYRQNSNFYYLSGFREDNSALVFLKTSQVSKTILFVQKKDELLELWSGKRVGEVEAKKRFLVDEVYTIDEFESRIQELFKDIQTLYYDFKEQTLQKLGALALRVNTHKNIAPIIGTMRLIKSKAEIKLIKKAIAITAQAHHEAMAFDKVGRNEYELQAHIEYVFKKSGAYSDAYTSIVACGNAANTLHYIENNKKLKNGELILIDAGCEYEYYASDITRTIPVNGKFTQAQKELYNMVLDVQLQIIAMIKPNIQRSKLQEKAIELLSIGMLKLGILKGDVKKLIEKEAYKKYYPHGIGHWMGLDVHDDSPYRDENNQEILLQAGMVLTIEPGIYIDENDISVAKKYRGIGIRIEDNILVTSKGHENLSSQIAKKIQEIQKRIL